MISPAEAVGLGAVAYTGAMTALGAVLYHNSPLVAPVISRIPKADAVALTFDDGPTRKFTIPILKALEAAGAKATFFCIGENMASNKSLVRDMLAAGHCIANHTWNHHHAGILGSRGYWRAQLQRTSDLIAELSGARPKLFRAPMGFKVWNQATVVREFHMRYVGWRAWAWDTTGATAERIFQRITKSLSAGDIILLHDGLEYARRNASQAQTVTALPDILAFIRDQGWNFQSLANL
ncbi:MAG: polysaccharide deacetylase family protein [Phycisphaerae bacterium]